GENTATGDPRLAPERITQLDLGLELNQGRVRGGANGFYAWIHDSITFENMRVVPNAMNGLPGQVNLKYVNTDLATLAGFDGFVEVDATSWGTLFANLTYVQGDDRTRNGDFATIIHGGPGTPSTRDPTKVRGGGSGVVGGSSEPLPSILPLEARLGIRVKPVTRVTAELSARIVDDQDRVAASLLETPTSGFTIWDLRGTWNATDSWLLVGGVENFTNKNFREHLDFRSLSGGFRMRQPGINFYFGSELKY
ncbi:MAG: TonB-dependent receptor, partial [Planctomycetaceae bacterium]|nr:TonB-dependent receptor [Planctomycetaceae bacterium]